MRIRAPPGKCKGLESSDRHNGISRLSCELEPRLSGICKSRSFAAGFLSNMHVSTAAALLLKMASCWLNALQSSPPNVVFSAAQKSTLLLCDHILISNSPSQFGLATSKTHIMLSDLQLIVEPTALSIMTETYHDGRMDSCHY